MVVKAKQDSLSGSLANHSVVDVFPTDLGWMGIRVSAGGVQRVVFDCQSAAQAEALLDTTAMPAGTGAQLSVASTSKVDHVVGKVRDGLIKFARGKHVDFRSVPLATHRMTAFQAAVIKHCRAIPHGETSSYGQLAEAAGYPRAARAVGSVMSRNTWPLIVPCHRVVSSCGSLRGFSSRRGLSMKQILLDLEQGTSVPVRW